MIRLATAHAKARLSKDVTERDAVAAEEILRFALFKEVVRVSKSKKNKKRKLNGARSTRSASRSEDSGSETEQGEDIEEEEEAVAAATKRMDMPAGKASPGRASSVFSAGAGDSTSRLGDTTMMDQTQRTSPRRSQSVTGESTLVGEDETQDETQQETQPAVGGAVSEAR